MRREPALTSLAKAIIREVTYALHSTADDYEEEGLAAVANQIHQLAAEKFGMALMYRNAAARLPRGRGMLLQEVMAHLDEICPDSGPNTIPHELRAEVHDLLSPKSE
jgi:hypothetical protein